MKQDDVYLLVGKRVREERVRLGLTLEELAEASSISTSFLAYVERGKKKPSLITIKKLAEGLRIPLSDLFAPLSSSRKDETGAMRKLIPVLSERTPKDRDFIVDLIKAISKRLPKKRTG